MKDYQQILVRGNDMKKKEIGYDWVGVSDTQGVVKGLKI